MAYIWPMTESYWQIKGGAKSTPREIPDVCLKCDIAIIGAGLTGIAIAHYLRKAGCENIIVLEKEYVGYGASGKNAGFLLAGLAEPYSRLKIGMGAESARELMNATVENHNLITEAIKENRIDCEYQRSGSYHLAVTEVERKEYDDTVDSLNRDGFKVEPVDYPIRTPAGRLKGYLGGYFNPADGCLDPFAFVRGLSRKVKVIESFPVEKIEKSNGIVKITGTKGAIKSEMAIIATNGYTPLLDRFFERLIFPLRGQMMATSALENDVLGKAIYYVNFGYDYFRQSLDNKLLIGGFRNRYLKEETGSIDAVNIALQNDLARYVRENLEVARFGVESRWSGLMAGTIDGLPIVGALPYNSSVIACAGFNGHGFGLGMTVARELASAILKGERSHILGRFSIRRFL
ncbi:MAG: FAD-binding oxidoreductase [Candidatus Zixiibacteriota bacterium]|nr:MAG: FAD-binding oxidoreductase [candidate division Zixibacteria bacterium]